MDSNVGKRYIAIFLLSILLTSYSFVAYQGFIENSNNEFRVDDHSRRWRESSYLKEGINPFDVIYGLEKPLSYIGPIPRNAGYPPWSMAMGIITNLTMFSEGTSRVVLLILNRVVMLLVLLVAYKLSRSKFYLGRLESVITALCCVVIPGWSTGFIWTNVGAIIGGLLFLFVYLEDRKPNFAGILLAIASIKPVLAAPFYLALLVRKHWNTFFVASSIPLLAWAYSCMITRTPPSLMLFQMLEEGSRYGSTSIFNSLRSVIDYSISARVSNYLSAIFCIAFALILWIVLEDNKDRFLHYSIAAAMSGMWMYSQPHDTTVHAIISLCLCVSIFTNNRSRDLNNVKIAAIVIISFYKLYLRNFLYTIFNVKLYGQIDSLYYLIIISALLILVSEKKIKNNEKIASETS